MTFKSSTTLVPTKAPNLPLSQAEYNQISQEQFSNALRLYFSQIDNFSQALTSSSTDGIGAANIYYNEGGTGAVTRSVQNKLRESVSVKDFGAVGDGTAQFLLGHHLVGHRLHHIRAGDEHVA